MGDRRRPEEWLAPVLAVFAGRSGSTLLMQLLDSSPAIAFDREYPFESRYLTYLLRWAWLLATTVPPSPEWNPRRLSDAVSAEDDCIGPPPFHPAAAFEADREHPLWAEAFEIAWEEFSRRARRQAFSAPDPTVLPLLYAEKTRMFACAGLTHLGIPFKTIYLQRDPRDVFLSIWSFIEKRGSRGFTVQADDTIESHARRFIAERRIILDIIAACRDPQRETVVRYEDLVLDLPGVAARLGQFLGVELDAAAVTGRRDEFRKHMTTKSPETSVARWKHDMPAELRRLFADEIGERIAAAGYEL